MKFANFFKTQVGFNKTINSSLLKLDLGKMGKALGVIKLKSKNKDKEKRKTLKKFAKPFSTAPGKARFMAAIRREVSGFKMQLTDIHF